MLEQRQLSSVLKEGYFICAANQILFEEKENLIIIKNLEIGDIIITSEMEMNNLFHNELSDCCVGISDCHQGLKELSIAFKEASEARMRSFVLSTHIIRAVHKKTPVIFELQKTAEKLISSTANT